MSSVGTPGDPRSHGDRASTDGRSGSGTPDEGSGPGTPGGRGAGTFGDIDGLPSGGPNPGTFGSAPDQEGPSGGDAPATFGGQAESKPSSNTGNQTFALGDDAFVFGEAFAQQTPLSTAFFSDGPRQSYGEIFADFWPGFAAADQRAAGAELAFDPAHNVVLDSVALPGLTWDDFR
jgi:hypothetical protein